MDMETNEMQDNKESSKTTGTYIYYIYMLKRKEMNIKKIIFNK